MDSCIIIPTSIELIFFNLYTLTILVMVMVVAFLHVFGRIFKEVYGLAKVELREIYISIFIGIFSLIFSAAVCQGLVGYIQGKYNLSPNVPINHFYIAEKYMESLIFGGKGMEGAITLSTRLFNIGFVIGSMGKGYNIIIAGKFKPFAPLEYLGTAIKFLLGLFYSFTVVSLQIQRISLFAAEAYAFSLILPVGLILRLIPITRTAGSFLIAFAFGIYVVWPLLFVFEYDTTNEVLKLKKNEIDKEVESFFEFTTPDPRGGSLKYTIDSLKKTMGLDLLKDLFSIHKILKDLSIVIVPQSTILAVINFTVLIVFINSLGDFIKSL